MNRQQRIIKAFGGAFQGSLAAAMGYTPPIAIPMQCYWCPDDATTTHHYGKAIGEVPTCDTCKRYSMSYLDRAIEFANSAWKWIHE